jgi:hypothetical protein
VASTTGRPGLPGRSRNPETTAANAAGASSIGLWPAPGTTSWRAWGIPAAIRSPMSVYRASDAPVTTRTGIVTSSSRSQHDGWRPCPYPSTARARPSAELSSRSARSAARVAAGRCVVDVRPVAVHSWRNSATPTALILSAVRRSAAIRVVRAASAIPAFADTSTRRPMSVGYRSAVRRAILPPWLYPSTSPPAPTREISVATASHTASTPVGALTLLPWPGRSGATMARPMRSARSSNCAPVWVKPWRATSESPVPYRRTPSTGQASSIGTSVVSTL